ncbi:MAG: hypothetical protein AAB367_02665 [Patescibacteria group bacterium]
MKPRVVIILLAIPPILVLAYFLYPQAPTSPATERRALGFIREIRTQNGNLVLMFDDALWLTGREAEDAAIEAGHCSTETRGECTPNDYFIENKNTQTIALELPQATLIFMETYETGEPGDKKENITTNKLVDLINDPSLHWNKLPYWITTRGTRITTIEEQYIP